MEIREFQQRIAETYGERDGRRGVDANFRWFVEEVGELARALRDGDREQVCGEMADCLAWLATLASGQGIDLQEAAEAKYRAGCPRCGQVPCGCPPA